MNKFLLSAKTFKKEHKFLFLALILSWIPGLILFILPALFIFTDISNIGISNILLCLIPILPPITVSIVSYIACKTMPKYPKLTKLISAILNCILILSIVILVIMIFIEFIIKLEYS